MIEKIDLSIVTVTYNEKENISALISELYQISAENNLNTEVIVVDDSSPDGTSEIVLELKKKYPLINLIKRPGKLGIASAYRDGVNAAQGDVIITMDADFSHPPGRLMHLYEKAKEGGLALGSRYTGKLKFETDLAHLIGTTLLNRWITLVLKTRVRDHTNGFLAVPQNLLKEIRAYANKRGFDPFDEILYGIVLTATARRLGFPVVEIKTPYAQRTAGETKIPFFKGLKIVLSEMWLAVELRKKLRY